MCILPCSIGAYLRTPRPFAQELVWFLQVSTKKREAWRALPFALYRPHVYQICNAMLFASRMSKVLLRKTLYLVCAWSTFFSFAQAQTPLPTAAPDIFIGVQSPLKKGAAQTSVVMESWQFPTQSCDAPVNDQRTLWIYRNNNPLDRIAGRVLSARIVGVNATEFRLLSPSSFPASISASQGVNIQLEFYTSVVDIPRSAQLILATEDLGGIPSDTVIVNLTGIRVQRKFQLIQQRYDFGTLPPNTSETRTFWWLRNTGTIPITWQISPNFDPFFSIINTVPSPVKNAAAQRWYTTVNPGDSVQLTVRFNGDVAGQYRNADFQPTDFECGTSIFFKLEANTTPNPPNITVRNVVQGVEKPLLNEIYLGEFACPNTDAAFKDTTLKIYTSGQIPLIVTGVTFNNPDFQLVSPQSLVSQRPDTITFNTSRDITIRYTPRTPSVQDILATMTLFSNSTTGTPVGSTTVNLRVRKDSINLAVSSQLVNFGSVVRGAMPPAQTITIRNTGTLPQAIPPFSSTNFLATFPTGTLQPGDSVVVTLRAINISTAGVFRETWIIQDNCFRQTPITLQITVNRPAPTIGLAVPVSFGRLVCARIPLLRCLLPTRAMTQMTLLSRISALSGKTAHFPLCSSPLLSLSAGNIS